MKRVLLLATALATLWAMTVQDAAPKTLNDQTCVMPFTYQNEVHHQCLYSEEFKKSWCFTDAKLSQWNFCVQEDTQHKQVLLKNLQEDMKTNLCLSADEKTVKAVDCASLLRTWKSLVWNWQSPGLISFCSKHICIRDNKIKLCDSSDREGDEFYLDDTGKIMNTATSQCLVVGPGTAVRTERCLD